MILFYLPSEVTSAAAKLISALLVAISAFQLIQSIFIWLKWKFRYLFAAFRTFPIPAKHLAGSIIKLCHWFFIFLTFISDKQWHIFSIYTLFSNNSMISDALTLSIPSLARNWSRAASRGQFFELPSEKLILSRIEGSILFWLRKVGLWNRAVWRQPVHKSFTMPFYWPLVTIFEKHGMQCLKYFQYFDWWMRKINRNTFVVRFHKNQKGCSDLIRFYFMFFPYNHVLNNSSKSIQNQ